jgi:hypothetical protein
MTLEQLQQLSFSDEHLVAMICRLSDFSAIPEGESQYTIAEGEESLYSRLEMHPSLAKPSLNDLEAEFLVYKAELIAAEEARLAELSRIAALRARLAAFDADPALPCARLGLHLQQPNWAIIHKEIIEQNNVALLEQMETEWAAFQAEQSAQAQVNVMDQLRAGRDDALAASDFTQLADAPLTSEEKAEYRTYRSYLRSLPAIYEGGHQIEPIVLTFAQWKLNPPSYPAGI